MDFFREFRPSGADNGESDDGVRTEWKPTSEVALGLADLGPDRRDPSHLAPRGAF